MPNPTRREREEAILKGLEDATYQELLDGDLVDTLVESIKAAHIREDAIRTLERKGHYHFPGDFRCLPGKQVLAILDGKEIRAYILDESDQCQVPLARCSKQFQDFSE